MKSHQNEVLSAVMDEEALAFEQRRMVQRLCEEDELQETWQRYHLMADVMRDGKQTLELDFAARVSAAIADEPELKVTPAAVAEPTTGVVWQPWAAAASVLAVVGYLAFSAVEPDFAEPAQQVADVNPVDMPQELQPASLQDATMNSYLVHHAQFATGHNAPYFRVVAYQEKD